MKKTLLAFAALFAVSSLCGQSRELFLADPFILEDQGVYYIYGTHSPDGIVVHRSTDLKSWSKPCGATDGLALHKKDTWAERNFWAPEVYRSGGRYIMVFSADSHIAWAVSDSPAGPFVQPEKGPWLEEQGIDSHVFTDDDGKRYLFWVRFDHGNVIYAAPLSEDFSKVDMDRVKFVLRVEPGTWEKTDSEPVANVAEGPFVLKHGGKYYMTYSCNHFKSKDYAVGCAVADSPMGPWTRCSDNPILKARDGYVGTGHHAFFTTTGGELHIVYHAHYSQDKISPRRTLISPARFVTEPGKGVALRISQEVIVPRLEP